MIVIKVLQSFDLHRFAHFLFVSLRRIENSHLFIFDPKENSSTDSFKIETQQTTNKRV